MRLGQCLGQGPGPWLGEIWPVLGPGLGEVGQSVDDMLQSRCGHEHSARKLSSRNQTEQQLSLITYVLLIFILEYLVDQSGCSHRADSGWINAVDRSCLLGSNFKSNFWDIQRHFVSKYDPRSQNVNIFKVTKMQKTQLSNTAKLTLRRSSLLRFKKLKLRQLF